MKTKEEQEKYNKAAVAYAGQLALKDLVDKHGKLPASFKDSAGYVLPAYKQEYEEAVAQHKMKIEAIQKAAPEAKTDIEKNDVHSDIMEMAEEISTLELILTHGKLEEEMMFLENDCYYFLEKYQNEFNNIYDGVEGELNVFFDFEMD